MAAGIRNARNCGLSQPSAAMTRKQSVTWCETNSLKNGGNQ
jgi:hypothetical protein